MQLCSGVGFGAAALGAGIQSSSSLVNGLVAQAYDYYQNRRASDRANKANWDIQERAFELNRQMWNEQNEYNSPKAQMQRLADAGLNPNLMYQQGNTGNASSAPTFTAPEYSNYKVPNFFDKFEVLSGIMDRYYDLALKDQQVQSAREDTAAKIIANDIAESTRESTKYATNMYNAYRKDYYNYSGTARELNDAKLALYEAQRRMYNYQANFLMPSLVDANYSKSALNRWQYDPENLGGFNAGPFRLNFGNALKWVRNKWNQLTH